MNMYYDISINGRTVTEHAQGATCREIYAFIEKTEGTVNYGTHVLPAAELAKHFAENHEAAVSVENKAVFPADDDFWLEGSLHFDRSMDADEAVKAFNTGASLFGQRIDGSTEATVTICTSWTA